MNSTMIKLAFVGDIMCEQQQLADSQKDDNRFDFSDSFVEVKSFFDSYLKPHYLVGNLETVLGNSDYTNTKYSFNTPVEFAAALKDCGFTMLTTANNHSLDRGIEGAFSTIDSLDQLGIAHVGTYKQQADCKYIIKEINKIKIGFISLTYGTNGNQVQAARQHIDYYQAEKYISKYNIIKRALRKCNLLNSKKEKEIVARLKAVRNAGADIVVAYMHWGIAWNAFNSNPDSYTVRLQKILKQAGADIIIGAHPHVMQKMCLENSKDRKIVTAYSLGNFISVPGSVSTPIEKMADYSAILKVELAQAAHCTVIHSIGVSFAKTIHDRCIKPVMVYDLYQGKYGAIDAEKLKRDVDILYQLVFGRDNAEGIKQEYLLYKETRRN